MKSICVENDVRNLPLSQRGLGGWLESQHPLTVGKEYVIHAMMLFENRLMYLVVNDFDYPRFHPAAFFGPDTTEMPSWWCYGLREGIHSDDMDAMLAVQSIWGYPEMVRDPHHRKNLILGDPTAQKIFNKYRGMSDDI